MTDRLRVVYADDEPIARRGIDRLLRASPGVEIVAPCRNGDQALDAIRVHKPDVAFLDVAMPAMSGLDVVARASRPAQRPAIVFVTAFDRFATEAFDVHAVDYLLKPFDEARFRVALERVRERLGAHCGERPPAPDLDALLEALDRQSRFPAQLTVKRGDTIVFIPVGDVDWCEADDNYVRIHAGGKHHLVRETMRGLERQLDPARFARIHRSKPIVNPVAHP